MNRGDMNLDAFWGMRRRVGHSFRRIDSLRFPIEISAFSSEKYERIYHIHIRKSAGTSINKMLLECFTADAESAYKAISRSISKRVFFRGTPVVGWSKPLIEKGAYGYAFSHIGPVAL